MNKMVRYTPKKVGLLNDFDAVFDRFFNDDFYHSGAYSPAVDVREEEDKFILEAELPGLSDKDLNIQVENNMLTLSNVQEEQKEENKKGYVIRERRSRSFKRSFMLPRNVDTAGIDARMKDGILTLEIPKSEEAKPRKIQISASK